MAVEERVTFCRICEPLCGMVATVEDGRLIQLRPDPDHPLSRGYACPKGIAMEGVQNDPDRVLYPLRRTGGPGEFERVSWEEAMSDIAARLRADPRPARARVGRLVHGQPGRVQLQPHPVGEGLPRRHRQPALLLAGSQDVNNRFAASALLYGSPLLVPIPDLNRTDFLLMVGANPLVSHGSVLSAPRVREQLNDVVARGGRVVVVDPRRTETARQYEHLAIRPDADAWLLLSMLHVIFEEGLADRSSSPRTRAGRAAGRAGRATSARARGGGDRHPGGRRCASSRGRSHRSRAPPRTGAPGTCLGRFGTLVAYLLDALNAVTGNLDRPGGAVFGRPPIALDEVGEKAGLATYGKIRSRIGGFPDVIGNLPATLLPKEITTPGSARSAPSSCRPATRCCRCPTARRSKTRSASST